MYNQKMEIKEPFIKVCPPQSNLQLSPRRIDTPRSSRFDQLSRLQDRKIGGFIVKSESITEYSIDGYTAVFDDRLVLLFEGEYSRSKKNGYGIEYGYDGGIVYEGNFRDDLYDGWGRNSNYSGQFREGVYDGYGIFSSSNIYYEGFFSRGLFNGEGVRFSGEKMRTFHPVKNINLFLTEGLNNNLDIMGKFDIEEIYMGEWKDGLKHGFGRLWKIDYWYSGQFSNDLPHGFGAEEDRKNKKVAQTKYRLGTKVD